MHELRVPFDPELLSRNSQRDSRKKKKKVVSRFLLAYYIQVHNLLQLAMEL